MTTKPPLFDEESTPTQMLALLLDRLVKSVNELHAPVPDGLTLSMQAAIRGQKRAVQLTVERQLGMLIGATTCAASAGLIDGDAAARFTQNAILLTTDPSQALVNIYEDGIPGEKKHGDVAAEKPASGAGDEGSAGGPR